MQHHSPSANWPDTKKRLVDAGVSLMRSHGFNATSLDEICAAATITKGGFFHYFKNKEDLAKAAIVRFSEGKEQEYEEASFRKLADPLDRVFGRLEFVTESVGGSGRLTRGCLIGMLAQELSATNPELREACRVSFDKIAEDFEKDLTSAKATYKPRASFEPKSVAGLYVTIIQGSLLMAKAHENNAVLVRNIDQFRTYLRLIFGLEKVGTTRPKAQSVAA